MSERFLRLKDVQEMLHVSRATVWRWTTEHGLKVVRVGDVVRIRESDLEAFLKRHEEGKSATIEGLHNGFSPTVQNDC